MSIQGEGRWEVKTIFEKDSAKALLIRWLLWAESWSKVSNFANNWGMRTAGKWQSKAKSLGGGHAWFMGGTLRGLTSEVEGNKTRGTVWYVSRSGFRRITEWQGLANVTERRIYCWQFQRKDLPHHTEPQRQALRLARRQSMSEGEAQHAAITGVSGERPRKQGPQLRIGWEIPVDFGTLGLNLVISYLALVWAGEILKWCVRIR